MASSLPELVSYATFLEYRARRLRAPVVTGDVLPPPDVDDTPTLPEPEPTADPRGDHQARGVTRRHSSDAD